MYLSALIYLFVIITALGFTGCTTLNQDRFWPEARPLGKRFNTYKPPLSPTQSSLKFEEPTGVLTLTQVLSLALIRNPKLKTFAFEVRAQEAQTLQAALPPNPVLKVDIENFSGSGTAKSFNIAETTIQLNQPIPLGGKISKRKKVAALSAELAGWDYEATRLDVFIQAKKAFFDVLGAQERLKLAKKLVQLASKVHKAILVLAESGEISTIEEKRAAIALFQTQIQMERIKHELEAARKRLASTWGSTEALFDEVRGELKIVWPVPSFEKLVRVSQLNPDIARWTKEKERRRAQLVLEKANVLPDITVGGGIRRLSETDDNAFVIGITIPLPILNRNQGGILEAQYRLIKAEEERKNAEVRVLTELAEAHQNLMSIYTEVNSLKDNIIPKAQSTYDSILEGYRQGKFSFLDVLDAQRTLFDTRLQYLKALVEYHKAVADIERLTGVPFESLNPFEEKGEEK
jgi:cobalt-zinc-cadmium efflux system outer membrane protein